MEEVENTETRTTRTSFLKRLGTTLAAAVGIAGAFASQAFALPGQCCHDCTCGGCCDGCPEGKCWCRCDCTGISESYCWYNPNHACVNPSQCASCPC
jgi:hypothetical protein